MISAAIYQQTDIPPGMTCDEYRRRHVPSARAEGLARSLALALLYPARMFAHLSEPRPAPGGCPAAVHAYSDTSAYGTL